MFQRSTEALVTQRDQTTAGPVSWSRDEGVGAGCREEPVLGRSEDSCSGYRGTESPWLRGSWNQSSGGRAHHSSLSVAFIFLLKSVRP